MGLTGVPETAIAEPLQAALSRMEAVIAKQKSF